MCAIAGFINFNDSTQGESTVEAMVMAQRHRGPDGSGLYRNGRAILGHSRLAIIDVASGAQPMTSSDNKVAVVLNGEIYNFKELRQDLEQKGHKFATNCDTEVLLYLYKEHGRDMAKILSGMFAFAIWDTEKEQLLLGRDRLGQKPLLYFHHQKSLVFASEMSALKCHPDFPHQLDHKAVSEYLSYIYTPPNKSIYKEVKKLSAAHTMLFDAKKGTWDIKPFWQLKFTPKCELNIEKATNQCRTLVTKAVERRLMSDVPSGTFLSGGVDSAIITAITARLNSENGAFTDCFTLGFSTPKYDERSDAKIAAEFINSRCGGKLRQHVKEVTPSDFDLVEKLLPHYGEPFADASMLPTALLSEFAGGTIKMALSGDGADEVFAGYERYIVMNMAQKLNYIPKFIWKTLGNTLPDHGERSRSGRVRRLCKVIAQDPNRQYFAILDRMPPALQKQLFGSRLQDTLLHDNGELLYNIAPTANCSAEKAMEQDLYTYLAGDTLPKMDIASMAYGLEVRSPFLDHELVEFASSLPLKYKLNGQSRKDILKRAFAEDIPLSTINAKKRGFGVPVGEWLRGCWQTRAQEILFDGKLIREQWVTPQGLKMLWNTHQKKQTDQSYPLWSLLMLALFLEMS